MNKSYMTAVRWVSAAALASALSVTTAWAQEVVLKLHQMLPAQAPIPSLVLQP